MLADQDTDWIILESFSWLQEALVIKSFLENAGIQCVIPEEHIGTINPLVTGMNIRILVRKSKLNEARKLLNDFNKTDNKEKCPDCGSVLTKDRELKTKNWIRFLLGLLTGIPMRRAEPSKRICNSCKKVI